MGINTIKVRVMTIKVTLKEFWQQGGTCLRGRDLFWYEYPYGKIGKFVYLDGKNITWMVNLRGDVHPWDADKLRVEIEVIPIYK